MPPPPRDVAGSPAAVHRAYRDLGVVGYLLYGVGAVSPFIRDTLGLSDTVTGLHSSLVAVGFLAAGVLADRLDRRAGASRVHAAAALLAAAATLLLAWAPAVGVTLLAASLIGLALGVFLGHVNDLLGSGGDADARLRLLRANVFAMMGPFVVPIIISLGLAIGVGWQLVFLPALVLVASTFRDAWRFGIPLGARPAVRGHLPRAYWLGWLLLVAMIGVEFAFAFWGATLVERRTGASIGDAALAAGGFFGGMLAGRVVLSLPAAGTIAPRLLVRGGLVLSISGAMLAWAAGEPALGAAGLLLAGLGVAGLYPLGVSMTLPLGAAAPAAAAARLTLATGVAILVAPLLTVLVGWDRPSAPSPAT